MELNTLEKVVLHEIATRDPRDRKAINEQIVHANVLRRENTGVGFFTHLECSEAKLKIEKSVLGYVHAEVDKLNEPMVFVLFTKEGFLDVLEGSSLSQDTTELDFSKVSFQILPNLLGGPWGTLHA